MFAIKIDPRDLRKLERALRDIRGAVPKALPAAINRTLNNGRTAVRREIRKRYLIKQKDIPVAVHRASISHLGGEIRIDQGMTKLFKFKVTPRSVQTGKKRKLVRAQVKKGAGGKLLKHAFVANMPSGHTGVFERKGTSRIPIKELLTIGASIMASQPGVSSAVQKAMGDALAKNIDSQISRFLHKEAA